MSSSLRGPLTPTQRDVYLDQQRHPELPAYRSIGFSLCLGPDLHRERWEEAVRTVFASEPILRTRLEESGAGLSQTVDPEALLPMGFADGLPDDAGALRAAIDRLLRDPQSADAVFQHWLVRTAGGSTTRRSALLTFSSMVTLAASSSSASVAATKRSPQGASLLI